MRSETSAARRGEEIDEGALRDFLRAHVEFAGELAVEQFPNGHSNLTYLVRTGGREYVLRRPPLGPVAPKAHDMVREYRVLRAVHPHYWQAPRPIAVCEDPAVLGAPFFLMERRRGVVLREAIPAPLLDVPDPAGRISEAFLQSLVELHAVDVARGDLAALGKPEGYVQRQVRGWTDRWERACTETVPETDRGRPLAGRVDSAAGRSDTRP